MKNSFFPKVWGDISTARVRPTPVLIPGGRPACGLQRCTDDWKS